MSNGDDKKDKDLKAMAFSDGSVVLHNQVDGFTIEMHDSELGQAEPVDMDQKDIDKIADSDIKDLRIEDGEVKEVKDDSKDVSSSVQDLQGKV